MLLQSHVQYELAISVTTAGFHFPTKSSLLGSEGCVRFLLISRIFILFLNLPSRHMPIPNPLGLNSCLQTLKLCYIQYSAYQLKDHFPFEVNSASSDNAIRNRTDKRYSVWLLRLHLYLSARAFLSHTLLRYQK